jgi:predicted phage terminase large subunit-like protein
LDFSDPNLITITFNDPAATANTGSDYTAIPTVSFNPANSRFYVRNFFLRKLSPPQVVQHHYMIDGLFHVGNENALHVFEQNGFQRLYRYIFTLEAEKRGYPLRTAFITRSDNKELRIMGLESYLPFIYWLKEHSDQDAAIKQLLSYRLGVKHQKDDAADALVGACNYLTFDRAAAAWASERKTPHGHSPNSNAPNSFAELNQRIFSRYTQWKTIWRH